MRDKFRWLDKYFEEILMSMFLSGIVVMMTTHVFFRYALKSPLKWTEEATRYMFIWFVFMGIGYGIKNETHIRINIIEVLCPKLVPILSMIQDVFSAAFIFYMIPASMETVLSVMEREQVSAGLKLPMVFVYGALVVGLFLGAVRIIQKFYKKIVKARRSEFDNVKEAKV